MELPPHIAILFENGRDQDWGPRKTVLRNEFLIETGDRKELLFFVEEGAFRVLYPTPEEDFTIRLGYAPDLLAVFPTILNGRRTDYSIQALRKSVVRAIDRNTLLKWRREDHEFEKLWSTMLEELVIQQQEREIDLLTPSPAERYHRILNRSPEVFQSIPLKYIASYLRMTPETLSRLRKS